MTYDTPLFLARRITGLWLFLDNIGLIGPLCVKKYRRQHRYCLYLTEGFYTAMHDRQGNGNFSYETDGTPDPALVLEKIRSVT
jgi:hypothetical protein